MSEELTSLLDKVNALFVHDEPCLSSSIFDYTLGRFPHGWCFTVINSWHKWDKAGWSSQFRGNTLEEAIGKFLRFVEENEVDVKSLMSDFVLQSWLWDEK